MFRVIKNNNIKIKRKIRVKCRFRSISFLLIFKIGDFFIILNNDVIKPIKIEKININPPK
ncbi:MAG: hypothetical protein Kow0019_07900 [Methanobacteriaceae archaeon]